LDLELGVGTRNVVLEVLKDPFVERHSCRFALWHLARVQGDNRVEQFAGCSDDVRRIIPVDAAVAQQPNHRRFDERPGLQLSDRVIGRRGVTQQTSFRFEMRRQLHRTGVHRLHILELST
jgi:hypothetical protein